MTMQVQNKSYLSFLANLLNKILYSYNFRATKLFLSWIPLTVKIFPCQIGSIVAEYYTIGIYHRNNIDNIVFSDKLCLLRIFGYNSVNNPVANKWTLSLSRMLPSHYYYSFSCILFTFLLLCNNQCIDIFLSKGLTDMNFSYYLCMLNANRIHLALNFWIGIRIGVCYVNFVISYFPVNFKWQLIVKLPTILSRQYVLLVAYLFSRPKPLTPIFSIQSRRIKNWIHAIIEQRITFSKIHHIKSIFCTWH